MRTGLNVFLSILSRLKVQVDKALGIKPKNVQMTPEKKEELINYYDSSFKAIESEIESEIALEFFKYMSDEVLETTRLIQWYLVLYGGTWFLILQSYDLLNRILPGYFIFIQIVSLFFASVIGVYLRHKAWSYRFNTDVWRQLLLKGSQLSTISNEKLYELNEVCKGVNIEKKELNLEEIANRAMLRVLPERYVTRLQENSKRKGKKDFREEMYKHSKCIRKLVWISISFYFLSIGTIGVAGILWMIRYL